MPIWRAFRLLRIARSVRVFWHTWCRNADAGDVLTAGSSSQGAGSVERRDSPVWGGGFFKPRFSGGCVARCAVSGVVGVRVGSPALLTADRGAMYRKIVASDRDRVVGVGGSRLASSAAPAAGQAEPAPKGDAFYVPPKPLAKAKPGTIIRSTPIGDAPAGARAWKILYHSRAVDGRDIAVSGVGDRPHRRAPQVDGWWSRGRTARRASPTCAHPRSNPTSCPAPRPRPARPGMAHSCPECANVPRRGLCGRRHRLRGARHSGRAPISGGRERGAKCARRGPCRARSEGRRRREQGARLRALARRPRRVVRR